MGISICSSTWHKLAGGSGRKLAGAGSPDCGGQAISALGLHSTFCKIFGAFHMTSFRHIG